MVRVESVTPSSIGDDLGLVAGTELISINGRSLHDFLDWEFLSAEDQFTLLAETPAGEAVEFDIERPEGVPMGVLLEPPRIRRCGNRCDFCFVDGLPESLRETLYIRDDDYRLSFRHGNFATLTNLKEFDVERILEYRLSPLYVSVHATDVVVRRRLLRNPRAPDIIEQLTRMGEGGIAFHTQIVLQPGLNDGDVLAQSLRDLWNLGETVLSVSAVPVGLTEFSKHALVREPTRDECREVVNELHKWSEIAMAERGIRWVTGSDELYFVAELPLPPAEWYGDFEQVENGVGSIRYLERQIASASDAMADLKGKRVAVVTGTAMQKLMPQVVTALEKHTDAQFEILPVKNTLFGPRVTTAGLLPGKDIRAAVADRSDFDLILIPAESLNDDDLFIDNLPFGDLTSSVRTPIHSSYDFIDVLAELS